MAAEPLQLTPTPEPALPYFTSCLSLAGDEEGSIKVQKLPVYPKSHPRGRANSSGLVGNTADKVQRESSSSSSAAVTLPKASLPKTFFHLFQGRLCCSAWALAVCADRLCVMSSPCSQSRPKLGNATSWAEGCSLGQKRFYCFVFKFYFKGLVLS